MMSNYIVRIL